MPTKLQKFAEFKTFPNAFTYLYDDFLISEKKFEHYNLWNKNFFQNNHPIVIEIGCGRGEYTVGLAEHFKDKNFIGIDYKSNRMWKGAKYAVEKKLSNVAFLRTRVEFLEKVLAPDEVSEIWITFPDPHERKSRAKNRLTHPKFLKLYKKFLKENGIIHLKTDNNILFEFTLEVLQNLNIQPLQLSFDISKETQPEWEYIKNIKTYYEQLFSEKGHTIKYCCFKISNANL